MYSSFVNNKSFNFCFISFAILGRFLISHNIIFTGAIFPLSLSLSFILDEYFSVRDLLKDDCITGESLIN